MASKPTPVTPARLRQLSIATVLTATLAGLVALTVIIVLAIVLWTSRETTLNLTRDKQELLLNTMEIRLREAVDPAANQLSFIAEVFAQPREVAYGRNRIADLLTGALAAAPQIGGITFTDPMGFMVIARRTSEGAAIVMENRHDNAEVVSDITWGSAFIGGQWTPIFFGADGHALIRRRHSVWRNGEFFGVLNAFVPTRLISNYLASVEGGTGGHGFLLYDRDYVLAHSNLARPGTTPEVGVALPRLDQVGDPVLANIWTATPIAFPLLTSGQNGHAADVDGRRYLFLHRSIYSYGAKPWLIGTYFRAADVMQDALRMMYAALAGVVILIIASIAAIVIARGIARPITRLAKGAEELRSLEFGRIGELPRSILREFDEQARAFNEMLAALRWFEAYVPRALVRRLMRPGNRRPPPSVEREVTVLFSDIVGFTTMSEKMTAVETAEFLNHHMGLATRAIEAESGTVDKFIGDSVMAFWGAPNRQNNHPILAARAAEGMAKAIAADNAARLAKKLPPVRVRIGIHTGRAVVGNIGAPGRVNYTIVGDTVNTAQRLETLGREAIAPEVEVGILVSAATAKRLDKTLKTERLGNFSVKGRTGSVEVYRLLTPDQVALDAAHADAASGR
jgi:class 3 adenylate cyclase